MKGALDVHRLLLSRAVAHEVVRLPRPVLTADDLPVALGLPPAQCLAVRCYVADGRTVAVLLQAGAVPDPAALLDALGARTARAATPAEVNAATDSAAGLVCPLGLPDDVPLLVDTAACTADVVYTAAGEGGVALGIRTRDLLAATGARVTGLSSRPEPVVAVPFDGVLDLDRPPARVLDLDARRPAG